MIVCPAWNEMCGRAIRSSLIGAALVVAACAVTPSRTERTSVPAPVPPIAAKAVTPKTVVTPSAPAAAQPEHEITPTPVSATPNPPAVHAPKALMPAPKPAIAKSPASMISAKAPHVPVLAESAALALSGTVILQTQAGQQTTPADMANTVIYFRPASGAVRPHPGHYRMYTHDSQFDPRTLVVPVGSTVNFPNQDHILHNVFSVSPVATFDLGYYGLGGNGRYTFTKPGVALIYCNVHSAMQADVLILDTPYYTQPSRNGRFSLSGLPAGTGKLWIWNPRAEAHSVAATSPSRNMELELTLTRPLLTQHVNKERRAY